MYRAIHLGGDKWAVRRFGDNGCYETQFIMKVGDPQLRSNEKLVIEAAKQRTDWVKV